MGHRQSANCRGLRTPHPPSHTPEPNGFALLAVLWMMVAVSALALAVSISARQAVATARHRSNLARAEWRAHGCLEETRAAIADVLPSRPDAWRALDDHLAPSTTLYTQAPSTGHRAPVCTVSLEAAGSALDVNAADGEMLRSLLVAAGVPATRADSLADALLDWRDGDNIPRQFGAEREVYEARNLFTPRNAPLASVREISRVRGWAEVRGLDSLLSVEPGRISLSNASLIVLAALPGIGEEALARIAERRLRGVQVSDLIALGGELSPAARDAMLSRYADLMRLTTPEADAWIVTARARDGSPAVTAVIELRLVRAGERAAIVRRRTWIE